ncbi:MAG: hypothetical protein HQM08_01105 [Candidatus Riflebacteria bacterium]|nr:hypothetical protein [Candidatus Riflebacteria bacterium]
MKKLIFFRISFTHIMFMLSVILLIIGFASSKVFAEKLVVPISKSITVKAPGVKKVMAIKPDVVQVMNVTDDEILLSGIGNPDTTQLIIWDKNGRHFYDVETFRETELILQKFQSLFTYPNVSVELFPDVAFIKGRVESEEVSQEAEKTLQALIKDRPIKNLLTIGTENPEASKTRSEIVRKIEEALKLPNVRVSVIKREGIASGAITGDKDYQVLLEGTVKDQNDFIRMQRIMEPLAGDFINLVSMEKPIQVVFQAYILQVDRTKTKDLNITWGGTNSVGGSLSQGTLNFFENPMSAFRGDSGPTLAAPIDSWPNPFKVGNVNRFDLIAARVNAWESDNKAKVLANPKLLVYAKTSLDRGSNYETLSSAGASAGGGGPAVTGSDLAKVSVKNTSYLVQPNPGGVATPIPVDANTELSISDLYVLNEELKFKVRALQSDATIAAGATTPNVFTREVSTNIRMKNSDTVVLGGLIRSNETVSGGGIPGLTRIPWIGRLFQTKSSSKIDNELVILLTPQILQDEPNLVKNKKFEVVPVPRRSERLEELHGLFEKIQRSHFPEAEGK